MRTKIDYETIPEFEKDFKKLEKRFRTLEGDFERVKKFMLETHYLKGAALPPNTLVDIEGFCSDDYQSVKIRKFACKALKNFGNNSGIKVIFVIQEEIMKITFVEMYYKGDKELEDRERLKKVLKGLEK